MVLLGTLMWRRLMYRKWLLPAAFLYTYFLFFLYSRFHTINRDVSHVTENDVTDDVYSDVIGHREGRAWAWWTVFGWQQRSGGCGRLQFSPRRLPLTALASYPGSGNTWVRHLIQQATGILTGSVNLDRTLKHHGFPGEGVHNQSCVVIKSHSSNRRHIQAFTRVVLLLRDPGAAILSEFNRQNGGHLGTANADLFVYGKKWSRFIQEEGTKWIHFYEAWLQFAGPLHILRYEDLRGNLPSTLSGLIHYLGFNLQPQQMTCTLRNSEGMYKRRNTSLDQRAEYFTDQMNANMSRLQERLDRLVAELRTQHHGGAF